MTLVSNTIPLGNHTVYSTYLVHLLTYIRHLSAEHYDVTLTIASAIPSVYRLSVCEIYAPKLCLRLKVIHATNYHQSQAVWGTSLPPPLPFLPSLLSPRLPSPSLHFCISLGAYCVWAITYAPWEEKIFNSKYT